MKFENELKRKKCEWAENELKRKNCEWAESGPRPKAY
jgi:hypothetical protein